MDAKLNHFIFLQSKDLPVYVNEPIKLLAFDKEFACLLIEFSLILTKQVENQFQSFLFSLESFLFDLCIIRNYFWFYRPCSLRGRSRSLNRLSFPTNIRISLNPLTPNSFVIGYRSIACVLDCYPLSPH